MKKILIIDDEKSFTEPLKTSLEKTGEYEVRTESEGKGALAAAREFKPDLVFIDVIMPDVDGGEVGRQIKSDDEVKDIPIVFVTAAVTKEEIGAEVSIIGGHSFIAKPVTTEEIISCIKKHLG